MQNFSQKVDRFLRNCHLDRRHNVNGLEHFDIQGFVVAMVLIDLCAKFCCKNLIASYWANIAPKLSFLAFFAQNGEK